MTLVPVLVPWKVNTSARGPGADMLPPTYV